MSTRYLHLPSTALTTIQTHAEQCFPEECCGLMLGHRDDLNCWVTKVIPTRNCWGEDDPSLALSDFDAADNNPTSKRKRFAIAPQDLLAAQKACRAQNLTLVGIYHSHPNGRAIPSQFDRAIAWPEYVYWIMSLQNGHYEEGQGWQLDEQGEFQQLQLIEPV